MRPFALRRFLSLIEKLMILDQLMPPEDRERFLAMNFLRAPFSRPGGAHAFCSLGTTDRFLALLDHPGIDAMAARKGERWTAGRSPTSSEAATLFDEGFTVLVRHAEQADASLASLAQAFASEFRAPVDVHVYRTPVQQYGFGWHYDAEDVFILQTEGAKTYEFRKNTVNPWPLAEAMPRDLRYERELMPLLRCRLEPGDWLYIPNGYWHRAITETASVSIAVGLMMPAAIDLLDRIRPLLRESILWRQRLPFRRQSDSATIPTESYSELLQRLAEDFRTSLLSERFLEELLDELPGD